LRNGDWKKALGKELGLGWLVPCPTLFEMRLTRTGHGNQRNIFTSFFLRRKFIQNQHPNSTINQRMGNHSSASKSNRLNGNNDVNKMACPNASGAGGEVNPKIQNTMKVKAENAKPVQKQLSAAAVNFDDFRSPGMKRTPLLERRNFNSKASLSISVQAVQAKPKQLFMDPRSPTIPRTPVPTDR
jgi:hypothetical protein